MKTLFVWSFFLILTLVGYGQHTPKGQVVTRTFLAPSLQGNAGGEDPMRRVTIYLPPGYQAGPQRYPTIYLLHGVLMNDSLMMAWNGMQALMDAAILSGHSRAVILVVPDSDTRFKGSFYTNSSLTGNWADYIGQDVVAYVDQHFRTLAERNSRGLAGHSMGGNGALKVGMLYPKVFGSVYALSPAVMGWSKEFNVDNPVWKDMEASHQDTPVFRVLRMREWNEEKVKAFWTLVMTDLARTYSPNPQKPPFYANLPVHYQGDSMAVNTAVVKQWEAHFPINMVDAHLADLKSLRALKLDWGRNDESKHIPVTCLQFSQKLESYGIHHFAEEYLGGHVNKLTGMEGRIYSAMLPFFDTYLQFENKTKPALKLRKKKPANH